MKKIVLLVFILVINNLVFGQTDSLINVLKKHPTLNDTVRLNTLFYLVDSENDIKIWPKYNLELKNSIEDLLKSTQKLQKPKDWYIKKLVTCLQYEGENYQQLAANNKLALSCFYRMLSLSQKINYKKGIATSYNNIGILKTGQKEYQEAVKYFLKYVTIQKELKKDKELGIGLNNIGYNYYLDNKNELALKYFNESLKIRKKIKEPSYVLVLGNIGNVYIKQNNLEQALSYYNESLRELKINGRDFFSLYDGQMTVNLTAIAKIKNLQNKNSEALKYALESKEVALKTQNLKYLQSVDEVLYKIYEATNKHKEALENYKNYITLRDSVTNEENKSEILKAEFKYESEKKEAKIKQLSQAKTITELENKRQKTTLFLLIFGVFSAIITSFLLFKRFKSKKQTELLKSEIEKTSAEKKASESELKALKSQMNPHFIFNALNSIQEQFMFGDKLVANEQMGNFTALTRQILSVSGKKKISVATEVAILTKYLELEKMRFETDFYYSISIDDRVDDEYIQLPPMLIQPFVENSIKHGLLHKTGTKNLTITFALDTEQTFLICTIQDNGIGREKAAVIKSKNTHESFSTASVAQRLQILNDTETEDVLQYEDLMDENGIAIGTKATLKISIS